MTGGRLHDASGRPPPETQKGRTKARPFKTFQKPQNLS
jgi:hypothetical protein